MRINELDSVCAPEKQDRINEFCEWCCEQLGIDVPHLRMAPKNDTSALGYTSMDDGSVTVVVGDRHQMDIMRTLAHELVHVRQMGSYEPDGATGSDDENEANAMAGVLMREWGQNNPNLYTEGVDVEEGKNKGLWHNIHAKRKRGEKPAKKGDKAYPKTLDVEEARFSLKKQKPSAQDRLNQRAAKHGIGTPDKEKFYHDMKKKFQSAMDDKGNFPGAKDVEDPHGHKKVKPMDLSKGGSTKVKTYKNESVEAELQESKTARMMALITALGATYGLEDEARAFADQIQQNIHNAQTAEPNPGRPDPVTPGNMKPGSDRVMRPAVDEMGAGGVAMALGRHALKKSQQEIDDDEANEASTTSKILKGAPGAPDGRPKSMREAVNVQSIKDEVMGAVRSGNAREMKRIDDTIAKRISDLMDLRGTAGEEVDAEIITALPVLKKAQMMLRDKQKMSEEKTRIDKKCWKGKKIGNPKTKVKGGVRVNNCVPAEE